MMQDGNVKKKKDFPHLWNTKLFLGLKENNLRGPMIEDIFDNCYDSYIDNLQDSVDAYYTCSECGKDCLVIVEDDSFGYDYGSIKSTHKQQTVYSGCCNANVEVSWLWNYANTKEYYC